MWPSQMKYSALQMEKSLFQIYGGHSPYTWNDVLYIETGPDRESAISKGVSAKELLNKR